MVVMLCMGLYKALGIVKSSEKVFVLKTNSFMLLGSNTLSTGAVHLILLYRLQNLYDFSATVMWGLSSRQDLIILQPTETMYVGLHRDLIYVCVSGACTMYDFHSSTDTWKFWTEKWAISKTFLDFSSDFDETWWNCSTHG